MADDPQLAARLLRLDKLHTTHFETGRTGTRIFFTHVILTFALLFLAVGDVTFGQQVAFAGITVTIRAAFFMVVAASLLAALVFYDVALGAHQEKVRRVITQEYEALGLSPNGDVYDAGESLFAFPSFGQAIGSVLERTMLNPMVTSLPKAVRTKSGRRLIARAVLAIAAMFMIAALVYILPAVSEGAAISYAVHHQGWNWLIVLATACLAILNIATWLATPSLLSRSPREAIRLGVDQALDMLIADGIEIPPEKLAALGRTPPQPSKGADLQAALASEIVAANGSQSGHDSHSTDSLAHP